MSYQVNWTQAYIVSNGASVRQIVGPKALVEKFKVFATFLYFHWSPTLRVPPFSTCWLKAASCDLRALVTSAGSESYINPAPRCSYTLFLSTRGALCTCCPFFISLHSTPSFPWYPAT